MRLIYGLVCAVVVIGLVAGCTTVQKGAGVGAAAGAGLGAIIGHQSGETGKGALIGAGAGALVGALAGDAIEKNQPAQEAAPEQKQEGEKFCPTCGKRFDASQTTCPYDGAELQLIK